MFKRRSLKPKVAKWGHSYQSEKGLLTSEQADINTAVLEEQSARKAAADALKVAEAARAEAAKAASAPTPDLSAGEMTGNVSQLSSFRKERGARHLVLRVKTLPSVSLP